MANDGLMRVILGASRSGKTVSASNIHRSDKRLIVWDPKAHWTRKEKCKEAFSLRELVAILSKHKKGPLRVAFTSANPRDFPKWAELAYWWCRLGGGNVVAEEVGNATNAAKAVGGWHLLLSQGLEYGINITVISQRSQETDKTAIGNASILRCFRQDAMDAEGPAKRLGVDPQQLIDLDTLQYVEKDYRTRQVVSGKEKIRRR